MKNMSVVVNRYDPDLKMCVAHTYSIPLAKDSTVLSALLHIAEHVDPTLAFRYGCRCTKCGECVVMVNGRPQLACSTRATGDMRISPLKNLPPVRDLVVDRSPIDHKISALKLYVCPRTEQALSELIIPQQYSHLIGCLECYGCLASCPHVDMGNEDFGGPYIFVRLAQLHLDPRDTVDRRSQALSLGVETCKECSQCACVKGIPIRRMAIATLLGDRKAG